MIVEVLEKEKVYTIKEYFKLEEKANCKSEFRNGKIVPIAIGMPEGSYAHNQIMGNIYGILYMILKEEYRVIHSEQAIFIPKMNQMLYADNSIIKGKPEMYKKGKRAILNPIVIFEVASDSTEKYDRHGKFKKYKTLPSFQEYVLVDQYIPIVKVFFKQNNSWQTKTYIGLDEIVVLESIGYELPMTNIYKNVDDLLNPQTILDL